MKKYLLSLILFVTAIFSTNAQNPFSSADNHRHLGLRLGLDLSTPGDAKFENFSIDMYNTGAGLSFGAVYNFPIVANLYVEPGAMLFYDTFGLNADVADQQYPSNEDFKMSVREFGLRVPVMIGYHFDLPVCKIHLFLGPEFRLGLYGREVGKLKQDNTTITESISCYQDGEFNRFNSAFRIGAGLEIGKIWVSLSGSFGSNILNNDNHVTSKMRLVNLTLGYNL